MDVGRVCAETETIPRQIRSKFARIARMIFKIKPLQSMRSLTARIPSARRRTLLVVVPIHVVAFTLLFFGIMRIVKREILNAHSLDARHLLGEAIEDLHPLMVNNEGDEVRRAIGDYAAAERLLELKIFGSTGSEIGAMTGADSEVAAFLAGAKDDSFRIERERGSVTLHGIRRLRSEGDCAECHASGATLGAATMQIDLTEQMGVANRSIRRELALLIFGWAILVGIVNIVLGKTTRRSLERLQLGEALEKSDPRESTSASGLLLDPVSAELYESFTNFREDRRNLDAEVATRLRRAEHMASLGQMAAGLAHEIKNPLAGIRGVVELLRDESEDESQRNLFQEIVKELDRVNRTIHLLLRFARPSAPNRVLTDVRALIEDSVRLIRPNLEKRSISLEIRLEPDVGRFPLDSTHMRHVLTNLVTNAADAIEDQDGGRISVSAIVSSEGEDLYLAVADNGPGIDASLHEKVFEPFFSTKFTGTGLGLAVVESLVSRSGGVVELFSVPGRGTTVYVLLPSEAPDDDWVPLESKGLVDGADFIDRR